MPQQKFKRIMRGIQGALIVASTLQIVLGFSGLWRNVTRCVFVKFLFPSLTIVCTFCWFQRLLEGNFTNNNFSQLPSLFCIKDTGYCRIYPYLFPVKTYMTFVKDIKVYVLKDFGFMCCCLLCFNLTRINSLFMACLTDSYR